MRSLQGHLLIASPHMNDPNFHRAVVLLVHHSEEGTFGLVINRPTDSHIEDFWHTVSDAPCRKNETIHAGGPVAGPLMALHTAERFGEIEVVPGLFFAAKRENIEGIVSESNIDYRLFIGHSGWGEGQLEGELAEGVWLSKPASMRDVFADESEVWQESSDAVGRTILSETLAIRRFPASPDVN